MDSPGSRSCSSSRRRSRRRSSGSRRAGRCTAAWSTRRGGPSPGAIVRSPTEFGFAGLDWEAASDADGRFVWFEAPATGDYLLNVTKAPFRPIVARMVSGGSEDLTLTLHRQQRVHGTVTDAGTGRPIERFDLISGQGPHRPGWTPRWYRDSPRSFGGGKFDLTGPNNEQDVYHSIRIEAEGYEPAEFLRFHDSLEDVAHDFRLRKAAMLAGIVRGPDGRPLEDVNVTLIGAGFDNPIQSGRLVLGQDVNEPPRIRTGPDGRYAFRPQGRHVSIIAIHDSGFAVRSADDMAASGDLTLAPWGRVEGLVKIGDRPASGETVAGWLRTSSDSASLHYEARTTRIGPVRPRPGRPGPAGDLSPRPDRGQGLDPVPHGEPGREARRDRARSRSAARAGQSSVGSPSPRGAS